MLEIKDLSAHYGVIQALDNVNLVVNQGEIVSLIGANGAGKTTLLNTICGLHKPTTGRITFLGNEISNMKAQAIVALGVTQSPEGRRVFSGMSVYENLQLGAYLNKNKKEVEESIKEVFKRFPILEDRKKQDVSTLSGGEQQMLAIGRALMSKPKILLLDEPSMGLAPILVKEIFAIIKEINEKGTTVLLVEQNARMALLVANRAYVMETGRIVLEGTGKQLIASKEISKVYLGG